MARLLEIQNQTPGFHRIHFKPVDTDLELVHGHRCCGGGAGLQDLVEAGLVLEADLRGTAQQLRLVGHERRLLLVQHRLAVAAGSLIGNNSC